MSDATNTAAKPTPSFRDVQLAKMTQWATREGLHPAAIKLAGLYANLNEERLKLISNYEEASDMLPGPARETALRDAWDAVIQHIRVFPPIIG